MTMKPLLTIALISSFAVLVASCDEIDEPGQGRAPALAEHIPNFKGIVGGSPTNFQDWQGVIAVRGGGMFGGLCTGTLIHPQVVLTAAHCVKFSQGTTQFDFTKRPAQVTIAKGANAFTGTQIARGAAVVVHPAWLGSYDDLANDVALIKLNNEIKDLPNYSVRDYPLPKDGDPGKLVGYGGTGGGAGSGVHRQGDTTLRHVLSTTIETGDPANTCQGDSGGPLFTKQNGEWVVTGITSFGLGDCVATHGSYSTNVLAYCDFINRTMIEFLGEDLGLEGCKVCEAPNFDGQWGQPCGTGYPCCPDGLTCRFPKGFAKPGIGMCSPDCCEAGSEESHRCPSVSDGQASCAFVDDSGAKFCGVSCVYDKDCPEGNKCVRNQITQNIDDKYCVPQAKGPGDEICEEPIDEGEADSDVEGDGGGDAEGEGEGSGKTPAEGEETVLSTSSGVGCQAARVSGSTMGLLGFLLVLILG
jgi:V8-like Glu-specific endopeptidase